MILNSFSNVYMSYNHWAFWLGEYGGYVAKFYIAITPFTTLI